MKLSDLKIDNSISPRESIDSKYAKELAQLKAKLPPILVTKNNVLIDGFHRVEAAKLNKQNEIAGEIYQGDDDIYALAAKRNLDHGKRLTANELARRVVLLLQERGWTQQQAGDYFGKDQSWVSHQVSIAQKVDPIMTRVIKPYASLRELAKIPKERQAEAIKRASELHSKGTKRAKKRKPKTEQPSSREFNRAVREIKNELKTKDIIETVKTMDFNPDFQVYNKSSETMAEIRDNSIHLIITSPPYNNNTQYDGYDDNLSQAEYELLLTRILEECYKKLVDGGRIAWVVPAVISDKVFSVELIPKLFRATNLNPREVIVWQKSDNEIPEGTAWGSWCSPSNPSLRAVVEFIMVGHKANQKLKGKIASITPDEFRRWTTNLWRITPASDPSHPAIYPPELVERLIKLYSFVGQTILDPFCGIGTTAAACKNNKRKFIGYEVSKKYYEATLEKCLL